MKGYLNKVSGSLFLFAVKLSITSLISCDYIILLKIKNKFIIKRITLGFMKNILAKNIDFFNLNLRI